jgi:hypothetical protein
MKGRRGLFDGLVLEPFNPIRAVSLGPRRHFWLPATNTFFLRGKYELRRFCCHYAMRSALPPEIPLLLWAPRSLILQEEPKRRDNNDKWLIQPEQARHSGYIEGWQSCAQNISDSNHHCAENFVPFLLLVHSHRRVIGLHFA